MEWYLKEEGEEGGEEDRMRVKFYYHLLVYPDISSQLHKSLTKWAADPHKPTISGPYCFQDELRAFSFDLVFDSAVKNDMIR